ncbi:MAG TPA: hypothetical protein VGK20_07170 [Candidatus Binatia bacterium]|jgi:hypothetical protein
MMTTILRRSAALTALLLMAAAGAALAAPIDDANALIAAISATGDSDRAWQLTQVVNSMSDSDLQAFSNAGINQLTDLINQQREAIAGLQAAGYQVPTGDAVEPSTSVPRSATDGYPVFTSYTPDSTSCPNSPNQTQISTVITIRSTLVGALAAYKIAKALYDDTDPVCHQLIVAIGVGSNPQTFVCVGLGIAETVVHVAFDVAAKALELVDFCDDEVDYAKIRTTFHGLEFIHNELTDHDTAAKLQLQTHDTAVQALIDDLIARLDSIQGKIDLLLKTQLQIAMTRKSGQSRPSIFYEERLDELCSYAQAAVNQLPVVYLLSGNAQEAIDEGVALKTTDPKLAADDCVLGFVRATAGSSTLQ